MTFSWYMNNGPDVPVSSTGLNDLADPFTNAVSPDPATSSETQVSVNDQRHEYLARNQSPLSASSRTCQVEPSPMQEYGPVTPVETSTAHFPRWPLLILLLGPWFLPNFGGTPDNPNLLVLLGSICGMFIFARYAKPDDEGSGYGFVVLIATAILSVPVILTFHAIALQTAESNFEKLLVGPHRIMILRGLVWLIGRAYQPIYAGTEEQMSAIPAFLVIFCSIALCEELLKLIPIIFLISKEKVSSLKNCLYIGAMSGLGFGIAEGIYYHYQMYKPMGAPFTMYIMRFFSIASLHACWTFLSSAALFDLRDNFKNSRPEDQWIERPWLILFSMLGPMTLHSLYNTAVTRSVLLAWFVIILTAFVVIEVARHANVLGTAPDSSSPNVANEVITEKQSQG